MADAEVSFVRVATRTEAQIKPGLGCLLFAWQVRVPRPRAEESFGHPSSDYNSKDIRRIQANSETSDRRLREDHLGFLDPALRAAAFAPLRARRDLHLAQPEGLARDVVPVWYGHRRETASRRCRIATTPSTQLEKTDAESALDLLLDRKLLAVPTRVR